MASVEAIHLGLSLASLASAGCMLWTALLQDTKWLHSLQLCLCSTFLLLSAALVILSSLQLHSMPEGGAIATVIDILVCLSLTGPPIAESIALWQLLYHWKLFYHLTWPPICLFLILKLALAFSLISSHIDRSTVLNVFMLACSGEYIILLAGGISICHKCTGRLFRIVLFVEILSPLVILVLTCVLLILSWLHLYDGGFTIILLVLLASMSICAARFALLRSTKICATLPAVPQSFVSPQRPNNKELELTHLDAWNRLEDGSLKHPDTLLQTCPGTHPGARHDDVVSYSLPERGVEPGDDRILSI